MDRGGGLKIKLDLAVRRGTTKGKEEKKIRNIQHLECSLCDRLWSRRLPKCFKSNSMGVSISRSKGCYSMLSFVEVKTMLTINCDGGRVTEPLGGHVLGHARVVVGIWQPGSHYNEMALTSDYEIFVRGRINGTITLQPWDWWRRPSFRWMTTHFNLTSTWNLLWIWWNFEMFFQIWKKKVFIIKKRRI